MILEPRLVMTWLTLSFKPRTIDEIPITTATPMTMPSTVSDERILLLRIVSTAMFSPSPSSPLTSIASEPFHRRDEGCAEKIHSPLAFPSDSLCISVSLVVAVRLRLKAQRSDWIQHGGAFRGIHAEKNTHARRHEDSRENCPELDSRGHADCQCDPLRDNDPEQHANRATEQRQGDGLNQELQQDVAAARAHGLADADLSGSFRHRNQHDVHDHDAANHQRDGGDSNHGVEKRAAEVRPDTQQAIVSLDVEIVLVAGADVAARTQDGARFVHRFIESRAAGRGLAGNVDIQVRAIL